MTTRTTILAFLALLFAAPGSALAQRLQLDALNRLADRASESVNIDLDPALLRIGLLFMKGDAEEKELKALLSGLKGIYVRAFEFATDVDISNELNGIRKQLMTPGWTRLVSVDSKRDGEVVEIYSWLEGNASGGLAIIAAERNEVTVVNIVGPFDIAKLAALKGLGIPDISR
jgi:hypothetical protein